ncbi:2TM domain-containing protein [Ornithinimicrobium kibberense]|uniref:2TM domain-containing protein n=1 Tax=Ornithinimicrobium kibberense TaxID=282060 RepID=A0ABV5V006_9MICO|nr:2TM domain-containing protein [Ornithinimicrobium kibberense]
MDRPPLPAPGEDPRPDPARPGAPSPVDPADDPRLRAQAKRQLEARAGFRQHLTVYLAVMGLLTAIWLVSGGGYFWPVWPAMGWGLAVVLHLASLRWDGEPSETQIAEQARRLAAREQGGPRQALDGGRRGTGRPGAAPAEPEHPWDEPGPRDV